MRPEADPALRRLRAQASRLGCRAALPLPSAGKGGPRARSGEGSDLSGYGALPYPPPQTRGSLSLAEGEENARAPRRAFRRPVTVGVIAVALAGCMARGEAPSPTAPASSRPIRERIAALALRQVAFGSVSLLPVRFESSRIAGPFEDGARTLYCVSSHMKGRTFGKGERPKAVIREDKAAGTLTAIDDDEVCQGHRTEPFPELETLGNAKPGPIAG